MALYERNLIFLICSRHSPALNSWALIPPPLKDGRGRRGEGQVVERIRKLKLAGPARVRWKRGGWNGGEGKESDILSPVTTIISPSLAIVSQQWETVRFDGRLCEVYLLWLLAPFKLNTSINFCRQSRTINDTHSEPVLIRPFTILIVRCAAALLH